MLSKDFSFYRTQNNNDNDKDKDKEWIIRQIQTLITLEKINVNVGLTSFWMANIFYFYKK
jgi:hypothetical protein